MPFGLVESESEAADMPERVAGKLLHPVERALRERHHEPSALRAEKTTRFVVRRRCAAQREAAVAAARTASDLARLVQAHAHPTLGERERARAACDAASDHRHLGPAGETVLTKIRARFLEPVGGCAHDDRDYVDGVAPMRLRL